ncbi:hypothetical protein CAOG_06009 [Capsaspora owczarzaki ATCC 30864]|uniref:Chlorophyllase n=1 Tax=Capsaspora owczarzaki (strain ATCC 30864) TaxID=595528 RepID=A0A0D2UKE7_CAPO3|nr:hypothetical protein CAOG_06009 [Capsaspora owczarzaki ATCC 30864]KJE95566.1 hypothetical protein CAOG_006009 [Capsaspora owczarzaki ATCC 30864]|eukprot:XP_004345599.1 hypothetical protein CAOG_06009 [Capsaspora owczarzaki ATCC 30864]
MRAFRSVLLLSLLLSVAASAQAVAIKAGLHDAINPFQPGSLATAHLHVDSNKTNSNPTLPVEGLDLYFPSSAGSYDVVVFLGGLAGDVPVSMYSDMLRRVAAHGVIVVGVSTYQLPLADMLATKMLLVIGWVHQNMNQLMINSTTYAGVQADFSRGIVLSGHSAGGKIVTRFLEVQCSLVRALVLVNPVDGEDPWGILPGFVIHPPYPVNFTLPLLVLGEGLGPVVAQPGFPACAPAGRNFPRFYNGARPCKWMINATDFGHADLLDAVYVEFVQATKLCASNMNASLAQFSTYRQFIAGTIVSMTRGAIDSQCDAYNYIQSQSQFPAGINTLVDSDLTCSSYARNFGVACPAGVCNEL